MIMRHWMDSPIVVTHGRLREWQIFTGRDGAGPNADTGAVAHYFTCYSRAVMLSGVTTEPTVHQDDVELMLVSSGEGIVEVGQNKREIRQGSSFSIPPGQEHRLTNTGAEDLELIVARRPPLADGSDDRFVVRHWKEDRDQSEWGSPNQGHWHHIYRGPGSGVQIGDIPPRKISHPHNHIAGGFDEIWYVRSGQGWHWMGRDYRSQTSGWALWLDTDEVHSLMNPSDENLEWIYCSSKHLMLEQQAREKHLVADTANSPIDPASSVAVLERSFSDLVDAYDRAGITIHGIQGNIPKIEAAIASLRENS